MDEVNTSSCPGLFKEIIVDRTLDGNVSKCVYCAGSDDMLYIYCMHMLAMSCAHACNELTLTAIFMSS